MVSAVDHAMPRASVPVVVAAEEKNSRTLYVQRDVKVICELVEEMRCIGAFIASPSIVGAAHVGAHSDTLPRPLIPGPIGIEPDWKRSLGWRLGHERGRRAQHRANTEPTGNAAQPSLRHHLPRHPLQFRYLNPFER